MRIIFILHRKTKKKNMFKKNIIKMKFQIIEILRLNI